MSKYQFEICANSIESCLAAQAGGADRVELCAGIPEGGTTPSYGEIAVAREVLDIKLHVIIRPRGGDFLYSPIEIKTMSADIEMARKTGVDGVVLGCLMATGLLSAWPAIFSARQVLHECLPKCHPHEKDHRQKIPHLQIIFSVLRNK